MFMGVERTIGGKYEAVTQQGVTVFAKRIMAQNSPSTAEKILIFATGDPDSSSHWLKQIRISISTQDNSVSATSMHSTQVKSTVITYHRCDRISCLGCGSIKLQALCYAAQQCAVSQCIGTVVNQNRPLCNMGLVAKSYAETTLSMMMGAWLIFTESYSKILDASLLPRSGNEEVNIEWVDDAFFGYVCSAKDMLGQMTSVITSSVGAGIIGSYNVRRSSSEAFVDEGQRLFDDGFTASVTIILNGVNAFMYQAMLLPLYFQIALQKTVVCTANDVFALFDATGTKIRLGRPDLQNASDVSSGTCVSAFLAAKLDALLETTSKDDVSRAANQLSRNGAALAGSVLVGSTAAPGGLGGMSQKSASILQLLNGNKPFSVQGVTTALKNAAGNAGSKMKPMMDRIKNNRLVSRIGGLIGKLQIASQIHLIDSMITYAIGLISGMADMAQVIITRLFYVVLVQNVQ